MKFTQLLNFANFTAKERFLIFEEAPKPAPKSDEVAAAKPEAAAETTENKTEKLKKRASTLKAKVDEAMKRSDEFLDKDKAALSAIGDKLTEITTAISALADGTELAETKITEFNSQLSTLVGVENLQGVVKEDKDGAADSVDVEELAIRKKRQDSLDKLEEKRGELETSDFFEKMKAGLNDPVLAAVKKRIEEGLKAEIEALVKSKLDPIQTKIKDSKSAEELGLEGTIVSKDLKEITTESLIKENEKLRKLQEFAPKAQALVDDRKSELPEKEREKFLTAAKPVIEAFIEAGETDLASYDDKVTEVQQKIFVDYIYSKAEVKKLLDALDVKNNKGEKIELTAGKLTEVLNFELGDPKHKEPLSEKQKEAKAIIEAIAKDPELSKILKITIVGGTDGTSHKSVRNRKLDWFHSKATELDGLLKNKEEYENGTATKFTTEQREVAEKMTAILAKCEVGDDGKVQPNKEALEAFRALAKEHPDMFLEGGGLFDRGLSMERAKDTEKAFGLDGKIDVEYDSRLHSQKGKEFRTTHLRLSLADGVEIGEGEDGKVTIPGEADPGTGGGGAGGEKPEDGAGEGDEDGAEAEPTPIPDHVAEVAKKSGGGPAVETKPGSGIFIIETTESGKFHSEMEAKCIAHFPELSTYQFKFSRIYFNSKTNIWSGTCEFRTGTEAEDEKGVRVSLAHGSGDVLNAANWTVGKKLGADDAEVADGAEAPEAATPDPDTVDATDPNVALESDEKVAIPEDLPVGGTFEINGLSVTKTAKDTYNVGPNIKGISRAELNWQVGLSKPSRAEMLGYVLINGLDSGGKEDGHPNLKVEHRANGTSPQEIIGTYTTDRGTLEVKFSIGSNGQIEFEGNLAHVVKLDVAREDGSSTYSIESLNSLAKFFPVQGLELDHQEGDKDYELKEALKNHDSTKAIDLIIESGINPNNESILADAIFEGTVSQVRNINPKSREAIADQMEALMGNHNWASNNLSDFEKLDFIQGEGPVSDEMLTTLTGHMLSKTENPVLQHLMTQDQYKTNPIVVKAYLENGFPSALKIPMIDDPDNPGTNIEDTEAKKAILAEHRKMLVAYEGDFSNLSDQAMTFIYTNIADFTDEEQVAMKAHLRAAVKENPDGVANRLGVDLQTAYNTLVPELTNDNSTIIKELGPEAFAKCNPDELLTMELNKIFLDPNTQVTYLDAYLKEHPYNDSSFWSGLDSSNIEDIAQIVKIAENSKSSETIEFLQMAQSWLSKTDAEKYPENVETQIARADSLYNTLTDGLDIQARIQAANILLNDSEYSFDNIFPTKWKGDRDNRNEFKKHVLILRTRDYFTTGSYEEIRPQEAALVSSEHKLFMEAYNEKSITDEQLQTIIANVSNIGINNIQDLAKVLTGTNQAEQKYKLYKAIGLEGAAEDALAEVPEVERAMLEYKEISDPNEKRKVLEDYLQSNPTEDDAVVFAANELLKLASSHPDRLEKLEMLTVISNSSLLADIANRSIIDTSTGAIDKNLSEEDIDRILDAKLIFAQGEIQECDSELDTVCQPDELMKEVTAYVTAKEAVEGDDYKPNQGMVDKVIGVFNSIDDVSTTEDKETYAKLMLYAATEHQDPKKYLDETGMKQEEVESYFEEASDRAAFLRMKGAYLEASNYSTGEEQMKDLELSLAAAEDQDERLLVATKYSEIKTAEARLAALDIYFKADNPGEHFSQVEDLIKRDDTASLLGEEFLKSTLAQVITKFPERKSFVLEQYAKNSFEGEAISLLAGNPDLEISMEQINKLSSDGFNTGFVGLITQQDVKISGAINSDDRYIYYMQQIVRPKVDLDDKERELVKKNLGITSEYEKEIVERHLPESGTIRDRYENGNINDPRIGDYNKKDHLSISLGTSSEEESATREIFKPVLEAGESIIYGPHLYAENGKIYAYFIVKSTNPSGETKETCKKREMTNPSGNISDAASWGPVSEGF